MDSVANIILIILALLVIIIFVGALYAFFYAIFQFIFSAGDPEKIKKAWNSIRYMILGIVFTLIILFFFPILLKKAKIPGYEFYTANNIFAKMSEITGGFINLGKEAVTTYQNGGSEEGGIFMPKSQNDNINTKEENIKDNSISPSHNNYEDLEL